MTTTIPSRGTASSLPDSPPTSPDPNTRQHPSLSKPQPQHVITAIPLTVTPASAVSATSSNRLSPGLPAFTSFAMSGSLSVQASPDMVAGMHNHPSIPPISLPPALTSSASTLTALPTPPMSTTATASSAMTEAVSISRGPNMIRRMSNKLRRRPSHSHTSRDQSAGPMMRRRSDSNRHITDSGVDFDGYEPEIDLSPSDEAPDDSADKNYFGTSPKARGLGITTARASISSERVPAPIRPLALEQGSPLTKVTKRKRKHMIFRIDYEVAKLSWHPSDRTQSIYIDDITELGYGKDATHYHDEYHVSDEERARFFTITYADPGGTKGRNHKTLHLIAPDIHLYKLWVDQLNIVSRMRIEMMNGFARGGEKSLRTLWLLEMRKRHVTPTAKTEFDQSITFAELRMLCRKLNISCSEQTLVSRFAKVDTDQMDSLNYAQYVQFMRKLLDRKEVREIYKNIKPASDTELDYESFVRFLVQEQRIDVAANPLRWQKIFDNYARISNKVVHTPNSPEATRGTISSRAFQILLSDSAIFPPVAECPVELRLDRPLNEYFISSSHNTYLPSRQYIAPSSVEPYKTALRAGCRCIEIDCWDGNNGKPEVRHGPYTSALAFSDVISVVNQYAFQTCRYPLIISLEVHCGPEQQNVMVQIMRDIFGEKLLTAELHKGSTVLPSPEELKGKILLKVKAVDIPEESVSSTDNIQPRRGRGLSSPGARPIEVPHNPYFASVAMASPISMSPPERSNSYCTTPKWTTTTWTPPSVNSSSDDSDVQAALASPKLKKHKTSKIFSALGELAIYTKGVSFRRKNFEAPELQTYNHVVSLGEGTFLHYINGSTGKTNDPALVDKHNMRHLMRVYPAGRRVGSTNFDPLTNWRHGVQMSALNWQTYDVPIQLNRAMFAAGSAVTGYALKPMDMRPLQNTTDRVTAAISSTSLEETLSSPTQQRKGKKLVQFEMEIISAKQLPRQGSHEKDLPTNPFIDLEVYCADEKARGVITGTGGHDKSAHDGLTGQGSPLRLRTSVRFDNGHDPVFNQKFSVSVETNHPELVFVRWLVWNARATDGKNESTGGKPIGTYTARLDGLQEGYRFVPLMDHNGEQFLFSTIFCRIKRERIVQLDEPNSSVKEIVGGGSTTPGSGQNFGAYNGYLPPSPMLEGTNGGMGSRRGFFGRVLHRSPSTRSRRGEARSEPASVAMSRTTSTEK